MRGLFVEEEELGALDECGSHALIIPSIASVYVQNTGSFFKGVTEAILEFTKTMRCQSIEKMRNAACVLDSS